MVKIIFLHPDLGIGGAERLVLDAAIAFKSKGYDVSFYTNHHNPSHCFAESKDGTFPVTVVGDWIPRSIFGIFKAAFAYLRIIYAAIYLALCVIPFEKPSLIFCDLISPCIPILKLSPYQCKVVFYCHHPDKLLTSKGGIVKKLYRYPLNWIEEFSISKADEVLVNSKYTAHVYRSAFQNLRAIPSVCYPSINEESFNSIVPKPINDIVSLACDDFAFLSINRFERKKNLQLAIRAMKCLKDMLDENQWDKVHLIMAGGFDPINNENVEHFMELQDLAVNLQISNKITFMKSPKENEKVSLLNGCKALIYTPSHEHFGIVPLEAMYFKKPVIAVNSGGPTEIVVNNVTGFLCEPTSEAFAQTMCEIILNPELRQKFGETGRETFDKYFPFEAFTKQLVALIKKPTSKKKKNI